MKLKEFFEEKQKQSNEYVDIRVKEKSYNELEERREKIKNSKRQKMTLKDVSGIFPELFFHRVDGGGDNAFIKSEDGYCIVIPIAECCPIQILSNDAFMEDLKSFESQLNEENNKQLDEIQKRKLKIQEVKNGLDSK